jgi:hypothetical protein
MTFIFKGLFKNALSFFTTLNTLQQQNKLIKHQKTL